MRIVLNLASQPFIELRPLYARLRIAMVALAVLAIPLGLLLQMEQRRAADADARMQVLQSKIQALRTEQVGYQSLMRQPQNAAVLSQSDFLNQLFARKAFSWTAVMMDLEDVLPPGVQVQNIDPIVSPDGHVTIRMRVAGPRERTVELVRNLEHSRRFLLPRLASESAETTSANGQGGGQPGYQPGNQGSLDGGNSAAGTLGPGGQVTGGQGAGGQGAGGQGAGGQATVQPVSAVPGGVNFDLLADYNPLPNTALLTGESVPAPRKRPTPKRRLPQSGRRAAGSTLRAPGAGGLE